MRLGRHAGVDYTATDGGLLSGGHAEVGRVAINHLAVSTHTDVIAGAGPIRGGGAIAMFVILEFAVPVVYHL